MKKITILILLQLFTLGMLAQEKMKPVAKGFVTIYTGQKMEFTNLRFKENQVVFNNNETKSEVSYFLNTIKLIEDSNHSIVYRKFEPPTSEKEVKKDSLSITNTDNKPIKKATKLEFVNSSTIVLDTKKLLPDEVREVLKTNVNALNEYNSGRSLKTLGDISLGIGVGLFVGGGISNLSVANKVDSSGTTVAKGSSAPLIAGIVLGLISIPLKVSAKEKIDDAIYLYNNKPIASNEIKYELNLIANTRGIGVSILF